jgi:hypothetical protein
MMFPDRLIILLLLLSITGVINTSQTFSQDFGREEIVLFQDDFSQTSSGWDRQDYGDAVTDYGDGVYRIEIFTDEYIAWASPYRDFEDVIIDVETYKSSGELDDGYGIICRHEDIDNFYMLEISSDGYAWIAKYFEATYEVLEGGLSEEVNLGHSANSLRAECVGNRLSLYVNGILAVEAYDSDLTHGDVGLIAETYSATSSEILFDNFLVTQQ